MLAYLKQVDLDILHALNSLSGVWAIDHTINFVTSSTLAKGMILLAAYWYFWFDPDCARRPRTRAFLVDGVSAGVLAVFIARLIANLFPMRMRPIFDAASGFHINVDALPGSFENWSSMPSDHAAFVMALAFALMRVSRPASYAFIAYSAIFVCLPRVYLGIHYPSDVIVGALIGAFAAWLAPSVGLTRVSEKLVSVAKRNFAMFYAAAFLVTAEFAQMFDNIRMAGRAAGKIYAHAPFDGRASALLALLGVAVCVAGVWALFAYLRRNASIMAATAPASHPAQRNTGVAA
ncbi:MAG: phosphatase PAP2 family protein [Hyphomicrobiales bacterium]|nr:phosphatase PAP2 family protein [Hyphomicrobiales bacterium]